MQCVWAYECAWACVTVSSLCITIPRAEEVPPVEEVKNEIEKPAEPDGRLMEPPPLPPTSSPTGYLHPYHYPGPYPHPPPIMYPPGPSSYHPYYGYPGGPPSGPYHMPPPPGMVVPAHPGPPMGTYIHDFPTECA